jgi:hypothetical protein
MAALCERLSRSVVERLFGTACSKALRGAAALCPLTCHIGSAKMGGSACRCSAVTLAQMSPIIRPFVSEAAVIIELAHMG